LAPKGRETQTVKSFFYIALGKMLTGLALAIAMAGLLALIFVGSAFRMSNITQMDVLSAENLRATMPLFGASVALRLVCHAQQELIFHSSRRLRRSQTEGVRRRGTDPR
jgi:hypothetical protein